MSCQPGSPAGACGGSGAAFLDYNRDGFADLFVANYLSSTCPNRCPAPLRTARAQYPGDMRSAGPAVFDEPSTATTVTARS
jgi:hypothetical protein